jgi:hypothetical protein
MQSFHTEYAPMCYAYASAALVLGWCGVVASGINLLNPSCRFDVNVCRNFVRSLHVLSQDRDGLQAQLTAAKETAALTELRLAETIREAQRSKTVSDQALLAAATESGSLKAEMEGCACSCFLPQRSK